MPNHGLAHPPAASVRHYFPLPPQRPARVRVKAQDLKGKTFTMSLKCVAGGEWAAWAAHGRCMACLVLLYAYHAWPAQAPCSACTLQLCLLAC